MIRCLFVVPLTLVAFVSPLPAADDWGYAENFWMSVPWPGGQAGFRVGVSGEYAVLGSRNVSRAYLFDVYSGSQVALLQPEGGIAGSFGWAAAIDGTMVLVGAHSDNEGEDSATGAVYVFDALTGEQVARLVADDHDENDLFGVSVAISATQIVVGAERAGPGSSTGPGAAYIFDRETLTQQAKLTASDADNIDRFGAAVDIDGGRVIVGAYRNDDFGDRTGSAYLFDSNTGAQVAKLLASDAAEGDDFGYAVGVSGSTAVVGAWTEDHLGSSSGSVYLFDSTTGVQMEKLVADDGLPGDRFGGAVAISGNVIVIGANTTDDGNNLQVGSAYIFDAVSAQQIARIDPHDGQHLDIFGTAVATDGISVVVGAPQDDVGGNETGSGYVYGSREDTDGDGLFDDWEEQGIPYVAEGGGVLHYMLDGADPLRKDLYVEIDAMAGRAPLAGATPPIVEAAGLGTGTVLDGVIESFLLAPVSNPDGSTGIRLHIDIDETTLPLIGWDAAPWPQFAATKLLHFGTPGEQGDLPLLEAKGMAFRYTIFANQIGSGTTSGWAELPGNDCMITLGAWTPAGGDANQQAGTFMHEIGHTLGLRHGGGDDINTKPNYYSVMSYTWQNPKSFWASSWRLDYSHCALPTLNEAALFEPVGIAGPPEEYGSANAIYSGPSVVGPKVYSTPFAVSGPEDWDNSGEIDTLSVAVDINRVPPSGMFAVPASPDQLLGGHDDWSNLVYGFRSTGFFAAGDHPSGESPEITYEMDQALDALEPDAVLCAADLDGDNVVGFNDLLQVLAEWGTAGGDLNADETTDFADLLILLSSWGPCS